MASLVDRDEMENQDLILLRLLQLLEILDGQPLLGETNQAQHYFGP